MGEYADIYNMGRGIRQLFYKTPEERAVQEAELAQSQLMKNYLNQIGGVLQTLSQGDQQSMAMNRMEPGVLSQQGQKAQGVGAGNFANAQAGAINNEVTRTNAADQNFGPGENMLSYGAKAPTNINRNNNQTSLVNMMGNQATARYAADKGVQQALAQGSGYFDPNLQGQIVNEVFGIRPPMQAARNQPNPDFNVAAQTMPRGQGQPQAVPTVPPIGPASDTSFGQGGEFQGLREPTFPLQEFRQQQPQGQPISTFGAGVQGASQAPMSQMVQPQAQPSSPIQGIAPGQPQGVLGVLQRIYTDMGLQKPGEEAVTPQKTQPAKSAPKQKQPLPGMPQTSIAPIQGMQVPQQYQQPQINVAQIAQLLQFLRQNA